jgi:hypothetical protein
MGCVFKCSINPINNPNPVYSHSTMRQYVIYMFQYDGLWDEFNFYLHWFITNIILDTDIHSTLSASPDITTWRGWGGQSSNMKCSMNILNKQKRRADKGVLVQLRVWGGGF